MRDKVIAALPEFVARCQAKGLGSRSVYCFVDLENGDVLKSASWKAPAKYNR